MHDGRTLAFYAAEAHRYAARYGWSCNKDLEHFLAILPPAARVLELGCGGGQDTAAMVQRGFHPVPTDGSPQMAAEASRRLGRRVQILLFHELEEIDQYDGVWASACLLHVPLTNLSDVLARIHRALRPGGWFYASYKAGEGEGRDCFDRYYNYPTETALVAAYKSAADWDTMMVRSRTGSGYDNLPTKWTTVLAKT